MTALDNVRNSYNRRLEANALVHVDSVTEWQDSEGNAMEIFVKPLLTVQRSKEIASLSAQGKPTEAMMITFVTNALDSDGKPYFRKADQTELMRFADLDIVARVVTQMNEVWNYNEVGEPDLATVEKS